MKKFLLSIGVACLALTSVNAQSVLATNISAAGNFTLLSSGCRIKQIIVTGTAGLMSFYDASAVTGYSTNLGTLTNITLLYSNRTTYATNTVINTYVGTSGYTNYYTNSGVYTILGATATATNLLPVAGAFAVGTGVVGSYPVDINLTRGLSVTTTTNVALTVYYLPL